MSSMFEFLSPGGGSASRPAIFTQLKTRVKAIVATLGVIQACLDKISIPGGAEGNAAQFLKLSEQTKRSLQLDLPGETISILDKAGLNADIQTVHRLLVTWLDTDILNSLPEHISALVLALTLAKQWVLQHCNEKNIPTAADIVIGQIEELLFALLPHMVGRNATFDMVCFLRILNHLTPLHLADAEIRKIEQSSKHLLAKDAPELIGLREASGDGFISKMIKKHSNRAPGPPTAQESDDEASTSDSEPSSATQKHHSAGKRGGKRGGKF